MSKWEKVRLGDVCDIERGGSPRPIDKYITNDPFGINWIKIGDTSPDSMYITKTEQKITPEGAKKSKYVKSGDFLLTNSMSFGRPYILKIDGCIHDGWLVLRDKKEYFHKEYLYYALSSKQIYEKFKNLAVGGVVNNLNTNLVKKVEVPLPPIEKQKQIAKTLDTVAELLALRKQQLAELDHLIKSVFYDMFGDPVVNEKGWPMRKIGDFSIVKIGPFGSLLNSNDYIEGGVPLINPSHIVNSEIIPDMKLTVSAEKYDELKSYALRQGDIVVGRRGEIGRCAVVNKEGLICGTGSMFIRIQKYFLPLVLQQIISSESIRAKLEHLSVGVTMKNLNAGTISNLKVPMIPLHLQNQFADIVAKIKEQKKLVKKAIDETQTLFDSLMNQYFD